MPSSRWRLLAFTLRIAFHSRQEYCGERILNQDRFLWADSYVALDMRLRLEHADVVIGRPGRHYRGLVHVFHGYRVHVPDNSHYECARNELQFSGHRRRLPTFRWMVLFPGLRWRALVQRTSAQRRRVQWLWYVLQYRKWQRCF